MAGDLGAYASSNGRDTFSPPRWIWRGLSPIRWTTEHRTVIRHNRLKIDMAPACGSCGAVQGAHGVRWSCDAHLRVRENYFDIENKIKIVI
jgi:hypothetical protein